MLFKAKGKEEYWHIWKFSVEESLIQTSTVFTYHLEMHMTYVERPQLKSLELGMVKQAWNPRIWAAEAGG